MVKPFELECLKQIAALWPSASGSAIYRAYNSIAGQRTTISQVFNTLAALEASGLIAFKEESDHTVYHLTRAGQMAIQKAESANA